MAAIWFAKLGINARIIDKRGTKIFAGQADGLQPRALEVFNSFGFAHRPAKEASVGFGAIFICAMRNDTRVQKILTTYRILLLRT